MEEDLVKAALGSIPASMVIKGGKLVNVLTEEVYSGDIALYGDRIVTVGDASQHIKSDTKIIDVSGSYVVPGLIDAHIHIEVSKLSPTRFAEAVLPRGTTSVVTGLDQIAVVCGLKGMRYCLDEANKTDLKVFNAAASKLPYTLPPSTIGEGFGPEQHLEAQSWREALGTWETTIDFVLSGDDDVYRAMASAIKNRLSIHGHAPLAIGSRLSAFLSAGIRSDHESFSKDEALEKLRSGIYVIIREAPIAHNLPEVVKIITESKINSRRVCLCTDDVNVNTIMQLGHLDHVLRESIRLGVEPIRAIQMCTINAAECYRIDHLVGSIGPGRIADMVIVDSLDEFKVRRVISNGKPVAQDGILIQRYDPPERPQWILQSFNMKTVNAEDLKVTTDLKTSKVKALSMNVPPTIPLRFRREVILDVKESTVLPNVSEDVLYVAVVERYTGNSGMAVAFISGFKLQKGAIATSLSPDDDNIVCIGADQGDMALAINHIASMQGGQVVVKDGAVVEELHLPIAGVMSDISPEEMAEKERQLDEAAHQLGCELNLPFMFMIFLPITAIPEYALTDKGLVESATQRFISPILGPA